MRSPARRTADTGGGGGGGGHKFEPTPCHITDVKANHKINLPSIDSRRAIVSYWRMYRYTCALSLRRSTPVYEQCE